MLNCWNTFDVSLILQEKRKTINGEDILWAMNSLGFENYVEPLKIYLQKYREVRTNNKGDIINIITI